MSARRHPNVANIDEVESNERLSGNRFGGSHKRLGKATGSAGIGCSLFEVPPGRALCPFHYHTANEESIFVLEGEGTMRIGDDEVAIRAGDYITFPVGPDHAHQLNNTGETPIRYLCFSTLLPTEVVGYPDSDKIAAVGYPPDGSETPWVAKWFPADAAVDYFHGEDQG